MCKTVALSPWCMWFDRKCHIFVEYASWVNLVKKHIYSRKWIHCHWKAKRTIYTVYRTCSIQLVFSKSACICVGTCVCLHVREHARIYMYTYIHTHIQKIAVEGVLLCNTSPFEISWTRRKMSSEGLWSTAKHKDESEGQEVRIESAQKMAFGSKTKCDDKWRRWNRKNELSGRF